MAWFVQRSILANHKPTRITESADQPLTPTFGTITGDFGTLPRVMGEHGSSTGPVLGNDVHLSGVVNWENCSMGRGTAVGAPRENQSAVMLTSSGL